MWTRLVAALTLLLERTALAQPDEPTAAPTQQPDADQIYQPAVTDAEDLPVQQKSYLVPAIEVTTLDVGLLFGAGIAGMPWANWNRAALERNFTESWQLDEDRFSTNQLGHPFCGALLFSAARSTGHGFWVSGIYALAGSFMWEGIFENEIASVNDMITTPFGGMFIGEAIHRFGRALLYRGYGNPGFVRKTTAAAIDPVGAINRAWWGDAWAKTIPPALDAHFGIGYQQPTSVLANHGGDGEMHMEVFVEHGLTGDRAFQPRRPLDHFELHSALNASTDEVEADLYVRGMLLGTGLHGTTLRGMGGLFGGYDYNNNDYTRASMLGVGPGATGELELSDRDYIGGTLAAYLVPYGSAGGVHEYEGPMRENHDGPGMAQLGELKVGRRGLYQLKLTSRAYQIEGRLVGDKANEYVVMTTAGARLNLAAHHAIAVETTYGWRRASFAEGEGTMAEPDRTMDVRAFYAITTDEILGR
jgi:hypothetical protein